jgi:hypothetical protein
MFVYSDICEEHTRYSFALRDARVAWYIAKSRKKSILISCIDHPAIIIDSPDVINNCVNISKRALETLKIARINMNYAKTLELRVQKRVLEYRLISYKEKINTMREVNNAGLRRDHIRAIDKSLKLKKILKIAKNNIKTIEWLRKVANTMTDIQYLEKYEAGRAMIETSLDVPNVISNLIVEYTFA